MSLIKGPRTIRRYVVDGSLNDLVNAARARLQDAAFQNPLSNQRSEEQIGWVTNESILDADFSAIDKWYTEPYIHAQMRIDKKTLPSNLFKAMFELRIKEWLSARNLEKIPRGEKEDIKDNLTMEMMAQTLPKVKTVEFCWNVEQEYVILLNTSDSINEKFVALFYDTFGLTLTPETPLMFLEEGDNKVEKLARCGISSFRAHALDEMENGDE